MDKSLRSRNSGSLLLSKCLTPRSLVSLAPKQGFPIDMLGALNDFLYQIKSVRCIFRCIKKQYQHIGTSKIPISLPSPFLIVTMAGAAPRALSQSATHHRRPWLELMLLWKQAEGPWERKVGSLRLERKRGILRGGRMVRGRSSQAVSIGIQRP